MSLPMPEAIAKINSSLFRRVFKKMGNRFEISVVCNDELLANAHIDAAIDEISRIEALFTTYKEESQTSLINRNAGLAPVKVDKEVIGLIKRSLKISAITQGAFDISYGSIDRSLWNFDEEMTQLPDRETAKKYVHLINYRNILLDEKNSTVFLKEKGMRINFGGIGKGYAADRAKKVLRELGVKSGIVNASGDLCVWGKQ